MIVAYYMIYTNHFDRPGIKATVCKFFFLFLPVSALNTIVHNSVGLKVVVEKFNFSELKIEKVKFFTQSLTRIFCTSDFKVRSCLASSLTFRSFLTLDPEQHGCLYKIKV